MQLYRNALGILSGAFFVAGLYISHTNPFVNNDRVVIPLFLGGCIASLLFIWMDKIIETKKPK